MSFLKMFIDTPLAGAIGWALLHSLWEGAITSGALAATLVAVRSARVRYAAACVAMLVMLAGFSVTFFCVMPEGTRGTSPQREPGMQTWNVSRSVASRDKDLSLASVVPWLAPFWIAGVALIYVRRMAGGVSIRRLRQRGVCSAPEHWQSELARLSAQLRISRPVLLLESCLADVPIVLGHFRPLILMPVGLLTGLPAEQVQTILLHELAHIRRHDYLVNVLQRLVEGLFFYHPAIWWISRVVRVEREDCCDDFAVLMSGNAHVYASALAALEQRRHAVVEPAVAATGGSVLKRIRRVLYPTKTNGAWTPFLAATIFITVTAVSLAAWQLEPSQRPSTAALAQNAMSSAYSKWLQEDVVYIIDDAERAAFLRLTTDAERDKFVEQFWLRRHPTPGTSRNEFKEEHYRRIAYANTHFATSTPGWQTDRGHIYIVYGPPDEINSHPSGSAQIRNAFEVWTYKHINGLGHGGSITFVDRTGSGDFRLAPGAAEAK